MLRKLKERAREKESRRFFAVYLVGKMLGVVLLLVALKVLAPFFHSVASAQSTSDAPAPEDVVNSLNTVWTLVAAFLVFFIVAGFMMLEAGSPGPGRPPTSCWSASPTRRCAASSSGRWASPSCSVRATGWIRFAQLLLPVQERPATYGTTGVAFLAFFLFQFAFADTCSTITSGAMVGRTGFEGDLLLRRRGVSTFIYPIIGHWIWGPGNWLATMDTFPFRDYHGSTVVHTVGGLHRPHRRHRPRPPHRAEVQAGRRRHDGRSPVTTIAAVGGVILLFGWYGFNTGSTLPSAMDFEGMGRVAAEHHVGRRQAGALVHDVRGLLCTPQDVERDHHRERLPRKSGGDHRTLLLGESDRSGDHRRPRRRSSCILGIDFMEWIRVDDPIGAVAVPRLLRHLGHAVHRPARHQTVRSPRPGGTGDVSTALHRALLRRRWGPAQGPVHRQLRRYRRHGLAVGFALMFTVGRPPAPSGSRRPVSSRASTSTSTAAPPSPEFAYMGVAGVGSGSTGGAGTSAPAGAMVSRTPVG